MIKIKCELCDQDIPVAITEGEFVDWTLNHKTLPVVQDHFPQLSAEDREMLVSGVCGKCWDRLFPDEE